VREKKKTESAIDLGKFSTRKGGGEGVEECSTHLIFSLPGKGKRGPLSVRGQKKLISFSRWGEEGGMVLYNSQYLSWKTPREWRRGEDEKFSSVVWGGGRKGEIPVSPEHNFGYPSYLEGEGLRIISTFNFTLRRGGGSNRGVPALVLRLKEREDNTPLFVEKEREEGKDIEGGPLIQKGVGEKERKINNPSLYQKREIVHKFFFCESTLPY